MSGGDMNFASIDRIEIAHADSDMDRAVAQAIIGTDSFSSQYQTTATGKAREQSGPGLG